MDAFHGKTLSELWAIVRAIPRGKVMSYGEVGLRLAHPASGFMVGRWMARAPDGVPWWRVVAKTGALPVGKRNPGLRTEQEERLRAEKVAFLEPGKVDMSKSSFA
ncbi:MAG: MGMT family protein [Armatimonadetes bacterium]|nr:MGMT family protein [Armatimonadota bacterium]